MVGYLISGSITNTDFESKPLGDKMSFTGKRFVVSGTEESPIVLGIDVSGEDEVMVLGLHGCYVNGYLKSASIDMLYDVNTPFDVLGPELERLANDGCSTASVSAIDFTTCQRDVLDEAPEDHTGNYIIDCKPYKYLLIVGMPSVAIARVDGAEFHVIGKARLE